MIQMDDDCGIDLASVIIDIMLLCAWRNKMSNCAYMCVPGNFIVVPLLLIDMQ